MAEFDDKRLELIYELLRRPIPWDPVPPWLKLDERLTREFTELEIQFKVKELDLQRKKIEAFGKMFGAKI